MEQHDKTSGLSWLQRERGDCPTKNTIVGNETRPNVLVPNILRKMEPDQIKSWETSVNP